MDRMREFYRLESGMRMDSDEPQLSYLSPLASHPCHPTHVATASGASTCQKLQFSHSSNPVLHLLLPDQHILLIWYPGIFLHNGRSFSFGPRSLRISVNTGGRSAVWMWIRVRMRAKAWVCICIGDCAWPHLFAAPAMVTSRYSLTRHFRNAGIGLFGLSPGISASSSRQNARCRYFPPMNSMTTTRFVFVESMNSRLGPSNRSVLIIGPILLSIHEWEVLRGG